MTPVVKQIDHLMIEAEDPSFLFRCFSETLGMTVAWPLEDFGALVSGGVCVGNVNLEFIRFKGERFGRPPPALASGEARFSGIAFEPHGSLASALEVLDQRGVAHEAPQPTPYWTNASFEGLLDAPWVTFLVEYHFDFRGRRRLLSEDLASKHGGRLGVREARELRIEVTDAAGAEPRWIALSGGLSFEEGPGLRLVAGHANAIRELVLRVASLKQAREELGRLGLLGEGSARHVSLLPSALQGLSIRLEE